MTNPPYLKAGCVSPPPDPVRAKAHVELGFGLLGWIEAVTRTLRHGGTLTVVHRGDRLADLLCAFGEHFGAVTVFPLWPSAGLVEARRIIVQGRKGSKAPLRIRSGLVLHGRDGSFTADAESILRHLAPLPIANES